MKQIFVCLSIGLSVVTAKAMPVLDPTNLAQNIIQVAQQKLTAKLNGDVKEINKTQLKADNQTVADVVGMNSTEKTNLNLDLAEFNYKNNPSTLIKNYYEKDLKVKDRVASVGNHLNVVKTYYNNNIMKLLNKLDNEIVMRKFTNFSSELGLINKKYDPFVNTNGKSSTDSQVNINSFFSNFENSGSTSQGSQNNIDIKPLENQYNADMKKVAAEQRALSDLQTFIGGLKGPDKNIIATSATFNFLMSFGHIQEAQKLQAESTIGGKNYNIGSFIGGIGDNLSGQISSITQGYQDQIEGLAGNALSGLSGDVFGGSVSEKGKGKEIKIDAKMGVLTDVDRMKLINESITAYSDLDYKITQLHSKLLNIKAGYDKKGYVEANSMDMNTLLKKGGAMDYTKMSNFDKPIAPTQIIK